MENLRFLAEQVYVLVIPKRHLLPKMGGNPAGLIVKSNSKWKIRNQEK